MKITGGCYCGDIDMADGELEPPSSAIAANPHHRRPPQHRDDFRENDFRSPRKYRHLVLPDLKTPVKRHFCSNCGTGIGSESPARPDSMIIKVGTVDDASGFAPQFAQFTCDLQDFHDIADGLPRFDKRPPRKD